MSNEAQDRQVTDSQTYVMPIQFGADDYYVTVEFSDTPNKLFFRMLDSLGNKTDWTTYQEAALFMQNPAGLVMLLTPYLVDGVVVEQNAWVPAQVQFGEAFGTIPTSSILGKIEPSTKDDDAAVATIKEVAAHLGLPILAEIPETLISKAQRYAQLKQECERRNVNANAEDVMVIIL